MSRPPVKPELTGWRDRRLSLRHRDWGYDAPGVDIDFLLIEYDMRKAMALIDYKSETAQWPPDMRDAGIEAQADMATRARLPFFIVRYGIDLDWYVPWCASDLAHKGWADYHRRRLSEFEFVTLLYRLRARALPADVAAKLGRAA